MREHGYKPLRRVLELYDIRPLFTPRDLTFEDASELLTESVRVGVVYGLTFGAGLIALGHLSQYLR